MFLVFFLLALGLNAQVFLGGGNTFTGPGIVNAYSYGAICDGVTRTPNDGPKIQLAINAAYGAVGSPHGSNFIQNKALYFPPGHCIITAPLNFTMLQGAKVFGAGRFTTTIENVTSGSSVFVTNGSSYSSWHDMQLKNVADSTAAIFDLDWDGTGTSAGLQSNSYYDMFFNGGGYGVRIGNTGFMGSETSFFNCYWAGAKIAGLAPINFNALQTQVFGGNFQGNVIGILVGNGSVPVISGVGFQTSTMWDIYSANAVVNSMHIQGCRSESTNFLYSVQDVVVSAALHEGSGTFVEASNDTVIESSQSNGTVIAFFGAHMRIQNSTFFNATWFQLLSQWWVPNNRQAGEVEFENVLLSSGSQPYTTIARQRIMSPAGAQTIYNYLIDGGTPGHY